MAAPSTVQKILYLGGKTASPEHREWLAGVLHNTDTGKLGLLLAVPNALIVATAGLLSAAIGDTQFGLFWLIASPLVLFAGAIPAISRRRVDRITRKNQL